RHVHDSYRRFRLLRLVRCAHESVRARRQPGCRTLPPDRVHPCSDEPLVWIRIKNSAPQTLLPKPFKKKTVRRELLGVGCRPAVCKTVPRGGSASQQHVTSITRGCNIRLLG